MLLSSGQLRRFAVQQCLQLQKTCGGHDPLGALRLTNASFLQRIGDVLPHRHVRIQRIGLKNHRDIALRRRDAVHHAIADADGPSAGLFQTRQHSERRGLAAARRPEQADELALLDREIEFIDRDRGTERLADLLENDLSHVSPLHRAGAETLGERALQEGEDHDERQAHHDGGGHEQ